MSASVPLQLWTQRAQFVLQIYSSSVVQLVFEKVSKVEDFDKLLLRGGWP